MGHSVPSKDRMARGRRPSGILSCEERLEHGHTHEEFRFCVHIVFLHFNFLVRTLKLRYHFVYDIFAIVRHVPSSCNVFECFTEQFIVVGAQTAMSQYTEIEELEAVIATQDLQDLYIRESSL